SSYPPYRARRVPLVLPASRSHASGLRLLCPDKPLQSYPPNVYDLAGRPQPAPIPARCRYDISAHHQIIVLLADIPHGPHPQLGSPKGGIQLHVLLPTLSRSAKVILDLSVLVPCSVRYRAKAY